MMIERPLPHEQLNGESMNIESSGVVNREPTVFGSAGQMRQVILQGQAPQPADSFESAPLKGDDGAKQPKKWLFMNYIAADCNLKRSMLKAVDDMEMVGSDDNTDIVAMIDAGPGPNPLDGAWEGARTFYVTHDETSGKINSEVLRDHGAHVDMSSPDTLREFLTDTMKRFPAEHVALIMSDHGGGFTGAMADDTDGGFMPVPGLRKAVEEAEKATGKKIDIIGFNACLMADVQVAYELKDCADIMLASEESQFVPGWSFQPILSRSIDASIEKLQRALSDRINITPEAFAKLVVEINKEHQKQVPTFSATDLKKIDGLARAVDGLAEALIGTKEKLEVKNAIMRTGGYGDGWAPYGDMHDLRFLARMIEREISDPKVKEAAKAVKESFEKAIMANEADPTKYGTSYGLHIYAPTAAAPNMGYGYDDLRFAKDTKWAEAALSAANASASPFPSPSGKAERPAVPELWPDGTPRR